MTKVLHKRLFIGDRIIRHNPGRKDLALCSHCDRLEAHTHLFYECVKTLVLHFVAWWNKSTDQHVKFAKKADWVTGWSERMAHRPLWSMLHAAGNHVLYMVHKVQREV